MTKFRGRQRTSRKNPQRQVLVDRQTTELITQHSIILGKIESVNSSINENLDNFTPESVEVLKELSQQLATLNESLDQIRQRLA